MNNQIKKAVFFKEYPCYHFAIYNHQQVDTILQFNCTFKDSSNQLQSNLPAAIVDRYGQREVLYLLQWNYEGENVDLFVKEFEAEKWISIKMNKYPDHIAISGGTIFVIGNEELFIFTPFSRQTDKIDLQAAKIVSVHPYIYQSVQDNNSRQEYEPGVYILYLSNKNQYYAGQYSCNRKQIKQAGILNKLTTFFQKNKQQIIHLQVIIPNVLGLAFLEGEKICCFNLDQMQLIRSTQVQFQCDSSLKKEKPFVRWKRHGIMEGYNETYLVLIGVKSFIYSFYFMIKYNSLAKGTILEQQPLENLLTSTIIDWSQLTIKPYLTFALEDNQLIDLAISTKGMMYLSKNSHSDLIGSCRYIDMNSLLNQYPILTQECRIWKMYYEDIQQSFKTNQNRLLAANRYPYQLVEYLQQNYEQLSQIGQIALNLWRNKYCLKSFITFGEELLIVRNGSISVFRNIQKELFDQEHLSFQQLRNIQPSFLNRCTENLTSLENSAFQDFQDASLQVSQHLPLISERSYKIYLEEQECSEDYIQLTIKNMQFQETLSELQHIITEEPQNQYRSLAIKQLQFPLICHQLKDLLNYFSFVFNSNLYNSKDQTRLRQYNKLYEKNSFIAKVIQYFYTLYHRSAEYYQFFGHNLIDLFVKSKVNRNSDDINAAVHVILQNMLIHLLPKEISDQNISMIDPQLKNQFRLFSNPFLEFLIQLLIKQHRKGLVHSVNVLRHQFSEIIQIGYYNYKSIFFDNLWRNISLFKILLLSNQTTIIQNVFLQYLLFNLRSKDIYLHYSKIKKYMAPRNIQVIERQLFFNDLKHDLKVDVSYLSFQEWPGKEANIQIASVYESVCDDIVSKQLLNDGVLLKNDNLTQISQLFQQLMSLPEFNEQSLHKIRQLVDQATVPHKQEKLQFYERILLFLVRLFNERIAKDSTLKYYQHTEASSPEEKDDFVYSRYLLKAILQFLKISFENYKKIYSSIYGKQSQRNIEEKTSFEEEIMSDIFLDQSAKLINSKDGPVLSSLSLKLLSMAVTCDEMNVEKQYHNSLTSIPNLQCFWFKNLRRFPKHQIPFVCSYLFARDKTHFIQDFLNKSQLQIRPLINAMQSQNNEQLINIINNFNFE